MPQCPMPYALAMPLYCRARARAILRARGVRAVCTAQLPLQFADRPYVDQKALVDRCKLLVHGTWHPQVGWWLWLSPVL